jgi:hypothetical protein
MKKFVESQNGKFKGTCARSDLIQFSFLISTRNRLFHPFSCATKDDDDDGGSQSIKISIVFNLTI